MEHQIKPVLGVVLLSLLLSSCYSYKNITKKEPITKELLSELKPGKKYEFELMIGVTQSIYITAIHGETITGYFYQNTKSINNRDNPSESTGEAVTKTIYTDNFSNIIKNVAKISQRKINPILISALVILPAAAIPGYGYLTMNPF